MGFASSSISSGVETGKVLVIRFEGVVGGGDAKSKEEPLDARMAFLELGESTLAERPWLITRWPFSALDFRATAMLFVDCPRPCGCGRVISGEGKDGAVRSEDIGTC